MEIGARDWRKGDRGFGRRLKPTDLARERLARHLQQRLCEKIDNYERAASRLKSSGDIDAATVLFAAADKLRLITTAA